MTSEGSTTMPACTAMRSAAATYGDAWHERPRFSKKTKPSFTACGGPVSTKRCVAPLGMRRMVDGRSVGDASVGSMP